MANFSRINCSDIKLGMKFPSPVFFDDGENMFVAENKTIKAYHIAALARWNIPYLLIDESGEDELEELDEFDDSPVEELYELDDAEELEEL